MNDHVISFLAAHNLQLVVKDVANWRPVPLGTYTHRTLPFGPMRLGITNGVICYMVSVHTVGTIPYSAVVEVHLDNMVFVPDEPPVFKRPAEKKYQWINGKRYRLDENGQLGIAGKRALEQKQANRKTKILLPV